MLMWSPFFNALHALAAVIWVGGMFFAYVVLRPAAGVLDPPARLSLWSGVFARFLLWVWGTVVVLLVSGYYAVYVDFGGFAQTGTHVVIMHGLGWTMIGIFAFLYFITFPRYRAAVAAQDWPAAGRLLTVIRHIVALNLTLGLLTVAVGASGRLW